MATARTLSQRLLSMSSSAVGGPVEAEIRRKITESLSPIVHLQIWNESYMHNVPKGSETHFKVLVVSELFAEDRFKSPLSRHREVNRILEAELAGGVHALSIVARTPKQWEKEAEKQIEPSPNCRGGFGK